MKRCWGRYGGLVICLIAFAAVIGFVCAPVCSATWSNGPEGQYHVYYWDDNPKFRYQSSIGQWEHYSTVGGTWYTLSATGLSDQFIGDGGWYNLGNGLQYRYDVDPNFGFYRRGAGYRFYYRYTPGQWYTSGYGGGWYMLGAADNSASALWDGAWHDLGFALDYKYDVINDFGFYHSGSANRFYYRYTPGQWYTSGYGGGWYMLGAAARSASVMGDGAWHSLGTEMNFRYDGATDFGFYQRGSAYRFYYRYGPGQWYNSGYGGGWYVLGAAGRSASVIVDGTRQDLGIGLNYRYDTTNDFGFYDRGGANRFYYRYTPGQWYTSGYGGGWYTLGANHRNAILIADGGVYDLGNGVNFKYNSGYDFGYYLHGAAWRTYYRYTSGQWYDYVTGRGWKTLGAAGCLAAWLGDGAYHSLGDGYQYQYSAASDLGYFYFDASHQFRQSYADGTWEYLHDTDQWSPWSAVTLLTDLVADRFFFDFSGSVWPTPPPPDWYSSSYCQWFVSSGGDLYFKLNDGAGWDVYRWDGNAIQEISGGKDFTDVIYLATVGADFFFAANDGSGYDLYRWNGASFESIFSSGYWECLQITYFTTRGTDSFFKVYTDVVGLNLYLWNGASFENISGGYNFSSLSYLTTLGLDLFFSVEVNGHDGLDLYRWNGDSFQDISGNQNFPTLEYCTEMGGDLFFTATATDFSDPAGLYRWDGDSFQNISGAQDISLYYLVNADDVLYFSGDDGTGYDLYRWNGSFQKISGDHNFDRFAYWTAVGSDLFFQAGYLDDVTPGLYVYDLYRWNGEFADVSGSQDFNSMYYLASLGGMPYFRAGFLNADTNRYEFDLYRWNGTSFEVISGNQNFAGIGPLAAIGTDMFFSAGFYNTTTGQDEYDLYRWNGESFEELSGNQNFGEIEYFCTVGTNLFLWAGSSSSADLYRWNGSSLSLVADLNVNLSAYQQGCSFLAWGGTATRRYVPPVSYSADVYVPVITGPNFDDPAQAYRLWSTHMDFLLSRMP